MQTDYLTTQTNNPPANLFRGGELLLPMCANKGSKTQQPDKDSYL
jgi:hypothetical protein